MVNKTNSMKTCSCKCKTPMTETLCIETLYRKGPWSKEEDECLIYFVNQQLEELKHRRYLASPSTGKRKLQLRWQPISRAVKTRSSKQCRERWMNNLAPEISRENWSPEEDAKLMQLGIQHPNKWSFIARHLPGRSQNHVKVRWKTLTKNKKRSFDLALLPYEMLLQNYLPITTSRPKVEKQSLLVPISTKKIPETKKNLEKQGEACKPPSPSNQGYICNATLPYSSSGEWGVYDSDREFEDFVAEFLLPM